MGGMWIYEIYSLTFKQVHFFIRLGESIVNIELFTIQVYLLVLMNPWPNHVTQ